MPFRLQSDEERNRYLRQLYGGSPPSMDYYRQLGQQKRAREEAYRAKLEAQREAEREAERRQKELEKAEQEKAFQELVQRARLGNNLPVAQATSQRLPEMPKKEKKEKEGGLFSGLGKTFRDSLGHFGTALTALNPFTSAEKRKEANRAILEHEVDLTEKEQQSMDTFRHFTESAVDSASFGLLSKKDFEPEGVAGIAGQFVGALAPGSAAGIGLRGTRLGAKIAPEMSRLAKAGQYAKEGAVAGGLFGLADAGATELRDPDKRDLPEHLKNIALDTTIGAVADPALMGLINVAGRGVRRATQALPTRSRRTLDLPENVKASDLGLPEGSILERPRQSQGLHPEEPTIIDRIKNIPQNIRNAISRGKYEVISDSSYVKQIEDAIIELDSEGILRNTLLRDGTLPVSESLTKSLRLTNLSPRQAAESIIEHYTPILKKLERAGVTSKDFDEYAAAMHFRDIRKNNADKARQAAEVERRLLEDASLTDSQVDELMKQLEDLEPYLLPSWATDDWIEATLTKHRNNKLLHEAQQEFVAQQKHDIKILRDAGVYSKKQAENIINNHPNFISMRREIAGLRDQPVGPSTTRIGEPFRSRQRGSYDNIQSPLVSAVQNRYRAIHFANMNKALQKVAKYAEIDKEGIIFRRIKPSDPQFSQRNVITFKQNGRDVHYEVPPNFMMTLENFAKTGSDNPFLKGIQSIAEFSKKGMTHYNLKFNLKAPIRDAQNAFLTSRTGKGPIDVISGFLDATVGDVVEKATRGRFKSFNDLFKKSGGDYSSFIGTHINDLQKVQKAMTRGSLNGNTVLNPFKAIERFGAAMERGPRLGEYRSARRQGYSHEDALFEAIDVIDYQDLGRTIKRLNRYVPFLGATIRGNIRVVQALMENPVRTVARGMMAYSVPTLSLYALRFAPTTNDTQRRKLENMPSWQKNLFWAIPDPREGSDSLFLIPKGFLVGQIFANPIERALDMVFSPEEITNKDVLKETAKDFFDAFAPPTTVAGITPILELIQNEDSFLGMPIETEEMQDLPKSERYNEYTSEAAKIVGKVTGILGLSPAQVDHIIRSMTGGVGRDLLELGDIAAHQAGRRPAGTETVGSVLNPFEQFIYDDTSSSKFANELYEAEQQERRTKSRVRREYQEETGLRLANDDAGPSEVTQYNEIFRDINREIREIRQDPNMSATEKREAISQLRDEQRAYGSRLAEEGVLDDREGKMQQLEQRLRELGPANVSTGDLRELLEERLVASGVPRDEVKRILRETDLTREQLAEALMQLME